MDIKLLPKNVVNQISAGEVVEKPASVVKELVENSIDAGANSIAIEIENGGIDRICVTDNGSGIKRDQIFLAFTPHATSKLEKIDDLYSLGTMGFRGEALATISAISKITMITKTENDDTGVMVEMEGCEELSRSEVACVTGTKIDVKNIFFNTPARLKFLRKPKTEENDIKNYVEKLILSHSDIAFKYIVDGKLIYNTANCSVLDNIYNIYGKDVASNVIKVDYRIGDYVVTGYVSKPEHSKANRTYQNLFVNNRFCNNSLVSTAVSNAYEQFAMKGKFPLYVLFLQLPQAEVDVNVHPNKLEVKFENTSKVYRVCNDAVFKALADFNHVKDFYDNDYSVKSEIHTPKLEYANIESEQGVSFSQALIKNKAAEIEEYTQDTTKSPQKELCSEEYLTDDEVAKLDKDHVLDDKYSQYFKNNKTDGSIGFSTTNNLLYEVNLSEETKNLFLPTENQPELDTTKQNTQKEQVPVQEEITNVFSSNYRVAGKVFNTYLILEFKEKVYFIDQHAAHERLRYDALTKAIDENAVESQILLVPYIFNVSAQEGNFLNENLETLNSFGIDICEYGDNCYKISAVPMILDGIDIKQFMSMMLSNINGFAKSPREILKEKFMQMACKSSVKGGDDLKEIEINSLLDAFKGGEKVLLCPHGRPIVVEITEKQIEKWFKRIV